MIVGNLKTYRLAYRDRRYHFTPLPGGKLVRVERWEPLNGGLRSRSIYRIDKARWLWKTLIDKGYKP